MKLFVKTYCCNKEDLKNLGDKRQEGLIVNRRIDTRVQCPAEMHVHLSLLPDKRFWVVAKFANLHSHNLSSPNKIPHFYSHQTHRSKISRSIIISLVDVEICPSNIFMFLMQ